MKKLLALALALAGANAFALTWNNACFAGGTAKNPVEYKVGEEIAFNFRLVEVEEGINPGDYAINWTLWTDDGKTNKCTLAFTTEPIVVKTTLSRPGFVRLVASVVDKKGQKVRREAPSNQNDKTVEFFGGAAAEPEKLEGLKPPADFDEFWRRQKATLAAVPMKAERKELKSLKNGTIYSVSIACAGPRPVTGYLTIPAGAKLGKKYPARLDTHGYGTRAHKAPSGVSESTIVLNINAHGQELNREEEYYKNFFESIKCGGKGYALSAADHPTTESAANCFFAGMTWRVMRALEYIKSLPEWNGTDLAAAGGSQGGLQTMWAASLDAQVTKADSSITWCCDMGGNATMGRIQKTWGVEWTPAMAYFDPINLAKYVPATCHVTIPRAGLGDYTCPPSGIAILYNNLRCPKKIVWMQNSTHGYVPPAKYRNTFVVEQK